MTISETVAEMDGEINDLQDRMEVQEDMMPKQKPARFGDQLSKAEKRVLEQILKGYSDREIGEKLFVCVKTVKGHATRIYKKMGVPSRAKLIVKVLAPDVYRDTYKVGGITAALPDGSRCEV